MISDSVDMSQSMDLKEIERLADEEAEMYPLGPSIALTYLSVLSDCEVHCFNEGLEVKRLGGLHVIGTSLHESRRIDNQVSHSTRQTVQDETNTQTSVAIVKFLGSFSFFLFLSLCCPL